MKKIEVNRDLLYSDEHPNSAPGYVLVIGETCTYIILYFFVCLGVFVIFDLFPKISFPCFLVLLITP